MATWLILFLLILVVGGTLITWIMKSLTNDVKAVSLILQDERSSRALKWWEIAAGLVVAGGVFYFLIGFMSS